MSLDEPVLQTQVIIPDSVWVESIELWSPGGKGPSEQVCLGKERSQG